MSARKTVARRAISTAAGVLALLLSVPAPAGAAEEPSTSAGVGPLLTVGVDKRGISKIAHGAGPSGSRFTTPAGLSYQEREPVGVRGRNDVPARAELIAGLGTRPGRSGRATVTGSLDADAVTPVALAAGPEDNGAIPLAVDTGVSRGRAVTIPGTIGDGPHGSGGSGTGDFDFYTVSGRAGEYLTADVDTGPGGVDSYVAVFGPSGALLFTSDDDDPLDASPDALLVERLPATGRYSVMVSGYSPYGVTPADPRDPGSGAGAGSEGPYQLLLSVTGMDADGYAVQLVPGDVLGVSVTGAADSLRVYDPAGRLVAGSSFDGGALYPASSPLPRGGNATAEHVATAAGRHTIIVGRGTGAYTAQVAVVRPYLEGRPAGTVQTLVLDFDGATVDPAIFGAPGGERALSPFASFLPQWGLTAADEPAVIEVAVDLVRRSFRQAFAAGGNPRSAIRVVVAGDAEDPWGAPDVSRVVVGGTRAEIGFHTVGVAQSLDPGNHAAEETSVILLDLLSGPAGPPLSLNTYLGPGSDRVRFVGQVLAKVIAHEMAHSVGSWHTTRLDRANNVMDEGGGRYDSFFGVGPDGSGGTADDVRPLFGPAPFSTFEGLSGTQDSAARTAWGLATGQRR